MLISSNCFDCRIEIMEKDQYMVKDELWKEAIDSGVKALIVGEESKIHLCIPCLEKRIKRKLNKNDFSNEKAKENVVLNIH